MSPTRRDFAALALSAPLALAVGGPARAAARDALVIAVGSPSPAVPPWSAEALDLAIRGGADVLAVDFVPAKDGTLMALADHELSAFTDVARRPEFAARKQTRSVGGEDRNGWFTEDFTLAELKTLARGGPPPKRGGRGQAGAGHPILTFEEVVAIARAGSVRTARVIGVEAGLVQPDYFAGIDMAVEPTLAAAIRVAGYDSPAAAIWVASDDGASLKTIGGLTRARRVLRLGAQAKDGDPPMTGDGLKAVRESAEAIAAFAARVLDLSSPKKLAAASLIADAHGAGLAVQAWAAGAAFPPPPLKGGDAARALEALFAAGCDAVAGDSPLTIARAREAAARRR